MLSPPPGWLKLTIPGTSTVTPSSNACSMLAGAFGPTTQKTVIVPCNTPSGVLNVARNFTAPPHSSGGIGWPKTSPQPYAWKLRSSVAVHVPDARRLPDASKCWNSPLAVIDSGWTPNVPHTPSVVSQEIWTVSPLGATPTFAPSATKVYV